MITQERTMCSVKTNITHGNETGIKPDKLWRDERQKCVTSFHKVWYLREQYYISVVSVLGSRRQHETVRFHFNLTILLYRLTF